MSFPSYPDGKPTGNPALPAIPLHWDVRRLAHCGVFLKGTGGSKDDIAEDGPPCVRYGDLYTTHSFFIERSRTRIARDVARNYTPIKYGDVLFAASGETFEDIGKSAVNLIEGDAYCGGDVVILRPCVPVDPRFLGYAADSRNAAAQKASRGRGTTVKHIYPDQLKQVVIALPPQEEQKAIVSFLDRETAKIDALVAEQERLIELLEEERQAVISRAVTKGLNLDASMKPSGIEWLGEVPAHWRVVPLKRIAEVQTGIAKGKDHGTRATICVPYLRVANVQDGYLDLGALAVIDIPATELERYALKPGDVLMNEGGDYDKLGRGYVWEGQIDPCVTQNHVFAVRPRSVSPWWLNAITGSAYAQFYFMTRSKQSTNLASISSTNLMELPVVLPPADEQEHILEHIRRQDVSSTTLIRDARESIRLLAERRAALISAAVTGQIDVRGLVPQEAA